MAQGDNLTGQDRSWTKYKNHPVQGFVKQPSSILVSIFSVNVFFFFSSSETTELKKLLSLQRYLATRCQKYSVESGERKAKRGGTKLQQYLDSSQALSAAC